MAPTLATNSNVPDTNPTAVLTDALQDFEKTLSTDQRQHFRNTNKPDASSVIAFVSTIDADNKTRAGRCIAPRLCTFLEAVRQFSDVVGTFVSSNPATAALIWGGVKTAIMVASNLTSYFDKITSLIMAIGRSCPKYKEFGLLYPGRVDLQKALCEYFAIVIRLCIKVIEISKKPGILQLLSPIFNPFEMEFKAYQDQLDQTVKDVQFQVSLASKKAVQEEAQLANIERQANSTHRSTFSLFRREVGNEQAEAQEWRIRAKARQFKKIRAKIKANLSALDHTTAWKRAVEQRTHGTAIWFQQDPNFCKWIEDQKTSLLWCSGKLGSGKTVLLSNVVAYLHSTRRPTDCVSYYFCQSDLTASRTARNVVGSIAGQLLASYIERVDNDQLENLYSESKSLNVEGVINFLIPKLGDDSSNFVILDGLDGCENEELELLSHALQNFCTRREKGLKILYAGRPDIEGRIFKNSQPTYRISLATETINLDIENYIRATLDQKLEKQELKLGNPTLILRVRDVLQKGAQGMFLWAYFLINEICAQDNDHDIIMALNDLPVELSEMFNRIMQRIIVRSRAKQAIKVLELCSVTKRPLTVEELREALTIELGQKSLDTQSLSNDIQKILADCCGLVFVDVEEDTVHLAHHSVKQHLISENSSLESSKFSGKDLDLQLGLLCMTYLDFSNFKRQLAKAWNPTSTIDPTQIAMAGLPFQNRLTNKIARHLLRGKVTAKGTNLRDFDKQLQEAVGINDSSRLESELKSHTLHFHAYARAYWIFHLTELDMTSKTMWNLFCKCVESTDIIADRAWTVSRDAGVPEHGVLAGLPEDIVWIITNNHGALLEYRESVTRAAMAYDVSTRVLIHLATRGQLQLVEIILKRDVDMKLSLSQALQAAAGGGHLDVVERLLAAKADVNAAAASDYGGRTALQAAAGGGHLDVVERLLAAKADVNAAAAAGDYGAQTALQAAAGGGHLDVVERLLAAKADVNAAAGYRGRTALQAAAGGGHLDVVERLLAAKADVNAAAAADDYGAQTALQAAAEGGHLDVVERLLAAKADVNAAARDGEQTALQAAAGGGHLDVVERLLAAKADVNAAASDYGGRTALQAAAGGGHLDVVERLLAAKADVNAAASDGEWTALQAAAGGGHLGVVERLLAAKADVNAAAASDYGGRTALQAAAGGGHLDVVERLLAAEADVNAAASRRGRTALQAAAGGGHLDVVERLLAAKADVNAAAAAGDYGAQTALQAAAGGGHLDVVERLLAAEADVNAAASDYGGRTALQAAAGGGHLDVVERLLAAKADVNAAASYGEWTALQAAAGGGHLGVVERLLAAKADVNAAAASDYGGRTALQAAAGGGHLDVVERLLAAEADVNAAASHRGRTALQAAAGGGHLDVVERLLAAKADVNAAAASRRGRTALQAAAGGGHLDVVERLLAAKADVNAAAASDYGAQTALQAAAGGGHLDVVERLKRAGATT